MWSKECCVFNLQFSIFNLQSYSTAKLLLIIPITKNRASITCKNLLTKRTFRVKKPKPMVYALKTIYLRVVNTIFASRKRHMGANKCNM